MIPITVTPYERMMSPFVVAADEKVFALLKQQHLPYAVRAQGQDFGYAGPTPLFSLAVMAVLLGMTGGLLWWAGHGLKPWPIAVRIAFGAGLVLPLVALFWIGRGGRACYVSAARVQVRGWSRAGFGAEEKNVFSGDAVLEGLARRLNESTEWRQRWAKGSPLNLKEARALGQRAFVESKEQEKGGALEVVVWNFDAQKGAAVANALAEAYCDSRNSGAAVAEVVTPAVAGQHPVSRLRTAQWVVAALAGVPLDLVLAVLTAAIRAGLWRRRLKRAAEQISGGTAGLTRRNVPGTIGLTHASIPWGSYRRVFRHEKGDSVSNKGSGETQ